jgi:hypothetical protein
VDCTYCGGNRFSSIGEAWPNGPCAQHARHSAGIKVNSSQLLFPFGRPIHFFLLPTMLTLTSLRPVVGEFRLMATSFRFGRLRWPLPRSVRLTSANRPPLSSLVTLLSRHPSADKIHRSPRSSNYFVISRRVLLVSLRQASIRGVHARDLTKRGNRTMGQVRQFVRRLPMPERSRLV